MNTTTTSSIDDTPAHWASAISRPRRRVGGAVKISSGVAHDRCTRRQFGTLRSVLVASAVLVAALAVVGLPDRPAAAWSYAATVQRPGAVSIPRVNATDWTYSSVSTVPFLYSSEGPVAYRSPASTGAQNVAGSYAIQRWTGTQWATISTQYTPAYTISAGSTWVRLPALNVTLQPHMRGYLRVSWAFAWTSATNAASLGATVILPSSTSDFACVTRSVRPCGTSSSWVRVGRPYVLGGGW